MGCLGGKRQPQGGEDSLATKPQKPASQWTHEFRRHGATIHDEAEENVKKSNMGPRNRKEAPAKLLLLEHGVEFACPGKQKAGHKVRLFRKNLAATYSRGSYTTTTIGKAAFDGRVRDGNGSDHSFMATKNFKEPGVL